MISKRGLLAAVAASGIIGSAWAQAPATPEARAWLGLGTNLGDRAAHLRAALKALAGLGRVEAVSHVYRTEPVGFREQPDFWNLVVRLVTPLRQDESVTQADERLQHFAGTQPQRVLLVTAAREPWRDRHSAASVTGTVLELAPLPASASAQLAQALLQRMAEVPSVLLDYLVRGPWRTFVFIVWLLALHTLGLDTQRYAERWRGPADLVPGSPWPRGGGRAGADLAGGSGAGHLQR